MTYSFKEHRLVGFYDAGDEYWEALEEGVVRLSRCANCGRWVWEPFHGAPTFRCGECGSWDLRWVEVEPKGSVYAWARTNQAFGTSGEPAYDLPYVTVEVELGGAGGPRIIGVLQGDDEGLRVGAEVDGSIEPPSETTLGYPSIRFTLVAPAS